MSERLDLDNIQGYMYNLLDILLLVLAFQASFGCFSRNLSSTGRSL